MLLDELLLKAFGLGDARNLYYKFMKPVDLGMRCHG